MSNKQKLDSLLLKQELRIIWEMMKNLNDDKMCFDGFGVRDQYKNGASMRLKEQKSGMDDYVRRLILDYIQDSTGVKVKSDATPRDFRLAIGLFMQKTTSLDYLECGFRILR